MDVRPLPELHAVDTSAQDGGMTWVRPYRTRREAAQTRPCDSAFRRQSVSIARIPDTHELVLKQPTGHGDDVRPTSTTSTPSIPLQLRPRGRKRDRGLGGLLRRLGGRL